MQIYCVLVFFVSFSSLVIPDIFGLLHLICTLNAYFVRLFVSIGFGRHSCLRWPCKRYSSASDRIQTFRCDLPWFVCTVSAAVGPVNCLTVCTTDKLYAPKESAASSQSMHAYPVTGSCKSFCCAWHATAPFVNATIVQCVWAIIAIHRTRSSSRLRHRRKWKNLLLLFEKMRIKKKRTQFENRLNSLQPCDMRMQHLVCWLVNHFVITKLLVEESYKKKMKI